MLVKLKKDITHHKSSQHDFYATFQVSWSHMTDNLLFTDKLFTDNLNLCCSSLPQISSMFLFWFKLRHWCVTKFLMSLKSNNITCMLCCIIMLYANVMLGKSRQPSWASRSQGPHINKNVYIVIWMTNNIQLLLKSVIFSTFNASPKFTLMLEKSLSLFVIVQSVYQALCLIWYNYHKLYF